MEKLNLKKTLGSKVSLWDSIIISIIFSSAILSVGILAHNDWTHKPQKDVTPCTDTTKIILPLETPTPAWKHETLYQPANNICYWILKMDQKIFHVELIACDGNMSGEVFTLGN